MPRQPPSAADPASEELEAAEPLRGPAAARSPALDPASPRSMLALQRGAGNAAVAGLLARQPNVTANVFDIRRGTERAVEKRPDLAAPKQKGTAKDPEHSSRADATSYESQPAALREVLERSKGEIAFSWFAALSDEARSNLVYTYNRMIEYGIWQHVRVIKDVEAGEKPVGLGPVEVHVAGLSQSIVFEVYDGRALRDTMKNSGKFGADSGPAGWLHPGQTSMREWTIKTPDGLHLSIGSGTQADAHIDKRSPTNKPHRGESQMDLVRSLEHHWQEVWPEFIRAKTGWLARVPQYVYDWVVDKFKFFGAGEKFREALKGIPRSLFIAAAKAVDIAFAGITFKPAEKTEHPDPSQRDKTSDIVTVKEYRFGSKGKDARDPKVAPAARASLDEALTAAVERAVEAALPGLLKPSGGKGERGDYPETSVVGLAIAGKVMHRAKSGGGPAIEIDLGPDFYKLNKPQVEDVKRQLQLVGKAVREGLAAELKRRGEVDLAQAVLGVRSGRTQLGPSPQWFALH